MAVCFFDGKYNEKYDCQYEIKNDGIEVIVNYDIMDEIPVINGIRTFGSYTEFKERDILIIDYFGRMNYLLKNANCNGHSEVLVTPDGGYKTKFFTRYYFKYGNYEKLCDISNDKNINKIRVYSKMINELIGYPSVSKEEIENEYIIKLKRNTEKQKVEINQNNTKSIEVSDDWKSEFNRKNNKIDVNLGGYIDINLNKSISYEEVYEYINELIMFCQ